MYTPLRIAGGVYVNIAEYIYLVVMELKMKFMFCSIAVNLTIFVNYIETIHALSYFKENRYINIYYY